MCSMCTHAYEMSHEVYNSATSRIQLDITSEPRLKIMNVVLSDEPPVAERDALKVAMTEFLDTYNGRLVLCIGFEGPDVMVSTQTIVDLVARLVGVASHMKKVKGCLVKPRRMTSKETTLATLFRALYPTSFAFLVTSTVTVQDKFVEKLVKREEMKRLKREPTIK